MSRFVVPQRPGLAGGEPPDGFSGRLTKYVPAEIVSIYTIATAGVISSKPDPRITGWIALGLMVVFCAGTLGYVWKKAPPPGATPQNEMGSWPGTRPAWAPIRWWRT